MEMRGLLDRGRPPAAAQGMSGAYARMVTPPESATSTVEKLIGRPAAPFRQEAADRADDCR
jgi:hypothetical protein